MLSGKGGGERLKVHDFGPFVDTDDGAQGKTVVCHFSFIHCRIVSVAGVRRGGESEFPLSLPFVRLSRRVNCRTIPVQIFTTVTAAFNKRRVRRGVGIYPGPKVKNQTCLLKIRRLF